jgi:hypothetical protein
VTRKLSECKLQYFTKGLAAVALKKLFGDGGWAGGRRGEVRFLENSASSTIPIFGLSYIGKWEQHLFYKKTWFCNTW